MRQPLLCAWHRARRASLGVAALLLPAIAQAAPALCEHGLRQSPIDIGATQARSDAPLRAAYRSAATRVVNDGHTVRLRYAAGNALRRGGERLALQQAHFHMPGGDRLRGEAFPLAVHLLHRAPGGQLVAVVLLFRQGAENAALAALLPLLPAPGQPEQTLPATDPAALLPPGLAYFAYTGSLTAPPCTEGVRWIVLQQVQTVSSGQLARLATLFPPSARAVQPLNGRIVVEHP
jgi:carbonic anhydrase